MATTCAVVCAPARAGAAASPRRAPQRKAALRAALPRAARRAAPARLPRTRAAGGSDDDVEQQATQQASDKDSDAAAADRRALWRQRDLPFADITLRAEKDGATARVHKGVLATYSRAAAKLLREAPGVQTLVLEGKDKSELRLLTEWLYQRARFTKDNIASACALAFDLDIPRMKRAVDGWLVAATKRYDLLLMPSITLSQLVDQRYSAYYSRNAPTPTPQEVDAAAPEFARMMALARKYPFPHFTAAAEERVRELEQNEKVALFAEELRAAQGELAQLRKGQHHDTLRPEK